MTALRVAAIAAVLVGAGCWCIAVALRRSPASFAAAHDEMFGRSSRSPLSGSTSRTTWAETLGEGALGRWVTGHFGPGLELVDMSPTTVVTRVVTSAGVVSFTTAISIVSLGSLNMLPFGAIWVAVVPFVGALAGWVSVHDIASRIDRARREMRRAANDFVQLVAVGLTTDQSVEEAIAFALDVGGGDGFSRLRLHVSTAPQRGVAVWDAIDEFGRRFDVRELSEFAASVERQGMQGVAIGDTVTALAAGMRAKALDELEREADRANANLSGPTIGFVVATIVFLAYPLAQRISDAFGG